MNDNWISVFSEQTPEDGQSVLVHFKDKRMDVCTYTTIFDKKQYVANSVTLTEYVTHWQPLPASPKM